MDEFKTIEEFEARHAKHFDPDESEFTFKQVHFPRLSSDAALSV